MSEGVVPPGKKSPAGIIFLFCFFFSFLTLLLGGGIPLLSNFSGLLARFTGVETTALASATGLCEGDFFTFTFTDKHEKVYHVGNSTCYEGIFKDGDRVVLWYQPDNPHVFIAEPELSFDMIFVVAFSIPLLITTVAFFLHILWRLRRLWVRKSDPEVSSNWEL
jgi:hypothetical protein